MAFQVVKPIYALLVVLSTVEKCSSEGYPYDNIYFIEAAKADTSKLHHAGWERGKKVYVSRVTVEDGSKIVGHYCPACAENQVSFAWNGEHRSVDINNKVFASANQHYPSIILQNNFFLDSWKKAFKVEHLQHSNPNANGITWTYAHKYFLEMPGQNLSMVVGKMSDGNLVKVCRGFIQDGLLDTSIGRHTSNLPGCYLPSHDKKQVIAEHFEVMGISFMGMRPGGKRTFTSTQEYCLNNEACFFR